MSRLDTFEKPSKKHRPSKLVEKFETKKQALDRDKRKARSLELYAQDKSNPKHKRKAALRLARQLRDDKALPHSMASSRYLRRIRERACGSLHSICVPIDDLRFYTIVPKKWRIRARELNDQSPAKLIKQLREDIRRCKPDASCGFLFAFLDAEFRENSDDGVDCQTHDVHVHCIVAGDGWFEALKRLSERKAYKSAKTDQLRGTGGDSALRPVVRPIVFRTIDQQTLMETITYSMKGTWYKRSVRIGEKGLAEKSRFLTRIPDPHQAELLLWLDQYSVDDFMINQNLFKTKKQFRLLKKV